MLISPVSRGLHDTLVPHTVHPGPPKNYFYILNVVGGLLLPLIGGVRNIFQNVHGALKYIYINFFMSSVDPCILI